MLIKGSGRHQRRVPDALDAQRRPNDAGGGVYHAIIGTLEQALVTSLIAVPLAVLVAIYLVEYGRGMLARLVTFFVDVMTGVPSIVAGLFIYTSGCWPWASSAAASPATLALAILMMPWSSGPPRRCSSWCRTSCARPR